MLKVRLPNTPTRADLGGGGGGGAQAGGPDPPFL